MSKKIKKYVRESSEEEGNLFSFYFDRIRNIKLIKTTFTYRNESNKFNSQHSNLLSIYKKSATLGSVGRHSILFFISLGPLIVFSYGGYQVILNAMTIGSLVAYIQYMNRIYGPANNLSSLYVDYIRAKESTKRIYPILSTSVHPQKYEKGYPVDLINTIQVKGLCHAYNANNTVLNNVNINFEKGKKYIIAGPNGCGKTTLIKFLSKLYISNNNIITINNGIDINEISHKTWSEKIGFISQDSAILYDTLRNNLLYGNHKASDEQLQKAIETSGLKFFLQSLPESLDSKIGDGDNSINPSGGQMQMLAFARLFLQHKEVIILDESTSAIDSENEMKLLNYISEYYKDAIVISISHKLNYILEFDEVIFLNNGTVVEQGSPQKMIFDQGPFYKLFKDQFQPQFQNSLII